MARRRTANQVVVIYWRDIPTHVNGVSGRDKHQFPMKKRFETAADRAAMKSGRNDANGYIAEVRRETLTAGDDPRAEAEALAHELDQRFTLDVLNRFVENGGFDPDADRPADHDQNSANNRASNKPIDTEKIPEGETQ